MTDCILRKKLFKRNSYIIDTIYAFLLSFFAEQKIKIENNYLQVPVGGGNVFWVIRVFRFGPLSAERDADDALLRPPVLSLVQSVRFRVRPYYVVGDSVRREPRILNSRGERAASVPLNKVSVI